MVGKALRTGGLVLPSDAADTGPRVFQGRDSLSETEATILALVKQGKTNRQIAAAQGISPTTVNAYLIRIGLKLRTSGRTAAVEEAENRGIDLTGELGSSRSTPDDPASGDAIGSRPIGSRPHDAEAADASGASESRSATTAPDGFRTAMTTKLWGPGSSISSADATMSDSEPGNHSPQERSMRAVLDYVAGATSSFVAAAVSEGLEVSVVEAIRGLDPADLETMLVDLGAAQSTVDGAVARFTEIQIRGAIPSAAPSAVPDVGEYLVRVSAPDGSDSWRTRRLVRRIMENRAHAGEVGWPDVDQVDSAELLVSELAGNIPRHAGTHGFVIATVTEGPASPTIRVGVRDYNRTLPGWRTPDGNAESGRGGPLLTMLATDHGVVEHVDGKTVWFELRAQRPVADSDTDSGDELDRLSALFPDLDDDSPDPPSATNHQGPDDVIGSRPTEELGSPEAALRSLSEPGAVLEWVRSALPAAGSRGSDRRALIDHLRDRAAFTHPATGFRAPDGWLADNRDMRRDHAAKAREIAERLESDPSYSSADAHDDARLHASDMREEYSGFRWQLVVSGADVSDPIAVAAALAARLPEENSKPAHRDIIAAAARLAELARTAAGDDAAVVVTSSQDPDGRHRLIAQLDYTRSDPADSDPGPTVEELRRGLSDIDGRIDLDTADPLPEGQVWHRVRLDLTRQRILVCCELWGGAGPGWAP
nr:LuxR C-terminal-related transcriptional regulator [Nocardia africana]